MKVLALSGSLRRLSCNTRLLEAARTLAPPGMQVTLHPLPHIPLYDQDADGDDKPAAVVDLRARAVEADAFLFATPEYNYSLSGVLKNAIDWLSRPAFRSPMTGKPAGVLSASAAATGGARAQAHLKYVLSGTLTPVFPNVEFLVPLAPQKFDEAGRLADDTTSERLGRYLADFGAWVAARR